MDFRTSMKMREVNKMLRPSEKILAGPVRAGRFRNSSGDEQDLGQLVLTDRRLFYTGRYVLARSQAEYDIELVTKLEASVKGIVVEQGAKEDLFWPGLLGKKSFAPFAEAVQRRYDEVRRNSGS